jgi:hypothetical protein
MFGFETESELETRKSVRKLGLSIFPKFQIDQHSGTVPTELLSALANLGLTGLAVPEEFGGLSATSQTSLVVMEELASNDLGPAIFISVHSMVSGIVSRYATNSIKINLLPKMAEGAILGAFGLTEPEAGSDASNLKTIARQEGDNFVIDGEKCYITSAGFAGIYVIFARTGGPGGEGLSAFLVESDRAGLGIDKPEKKMGCELSPIASLHLSGVKVPKENLLGSLGQGYKIALSGLAGGRVNIAACANGLSRAAIERATKHLRERKQFGQALADFQGLQFMLADMRIKLEAAQLLTWQAAREIDRDPASRENRINSSMAKCFATDAAMHITTDAVQLLGGAGYIKEYRVESLMRDAKMLQIVEGTNQIQRALIARETLRD